MTRHYDERGNEYRTYGFRIGAPHPLAGPAADDRRRVAGPAPADDPGERIVEMAKAYVMRHPEITLAHAYKIVSSAGPGAEAMREYNASARPSAAGTRTYAKQRTDARRALAEIEVKIDVEARRLCDADDALTYPQAVQRIMSDGGDLARSYREASASGTARGRNPTGE